MLNKMSLRFNIKNDINIKTYIYFKPTENNNLDDIKILLEEDDTIEIHSNNDNANPNNSYKNITDYIYRIISNSGFLCKGLNSKYILESFEYVDAVIIIGSSNNILPNGNIFGFALLNFNENTNSIYIDVICSHIGIKGAGDILINKIEDISRRLLITKIHLTSVKSAFSFYEKYGYTKQDKLCDDNMCEMTKTINTNSKNGGNRKRKRKTIRRKTIRRKTIRKRRHKIYL